METVAEHEVGLGWEGEMDPLLKLLLHDTLTETQARELRLALDLHVEELEKWVKAFPDDAVSQASLAAAWDLQSKVFREETK